MAGYAPLRKRAWWWPVAVPAAATAAAWLIQVLVSDELPGWARAALVVAGALSTLLAFLLPTRQLINERRDRTEAEELAANAVASYKVKVHDMLIPLTLAVSNVVTASNARIRREEQQTLRQLVVDLAAEKIGPDRSRACFYGLDSSGNPGRHLRLKNWHGRNKMPQQEFTEGTPHGSLVMALIDELGAKLIDDVDKVGLSGAPGQFEHKTLIFATVFAHEIPLGILTLDSLRPGDLNVDDLDLMRLFAQLLATGLAVG